MAAAWTGDLSQNGSGWISREELIAFFARRMTRQKIECLKLSCYDLKSKEPGSKQGPRHPDDPGVEEGQLGGVDVCPGEAWVNRVEPALPLLHCFELTGHQDVRKLGPGDSRGDH